MPKIFFVGNLETTHWNMSDRQENDRTMVRNRHGTSKRVGGTKNVSIFGRRL